MGIDRVERMLLNACYSGVQTDVIVENIAHVSSRIRNSFKVLINVGLLVIQALVMEKNNPYHDRPTARS